MFFAFSILGLYFIFDLVKESAAGEQFCFRFEIFSLKLLPKLAPPPKIKNPGYTSLDRSKDASCNVKQMVDRATKKFSRPRHTVAYCRLTACEL